MRLHPEACCAGAAYPDLSPLRNSRIKVIYRVTPETLQRDEAMRKAHAASRRALHEDEEALHFRGVNPQKGDTSHG